VDYDFVAVIILGGFLESFRYSKITMNLLFEFIPVDDVPKLLGRTLTNNPIY